MEAIEFGSSASRTSGMLSSQHSRTTDPAVWARKKKEHDEAMRIKAISDRATRDVGSRHDLRTVETMQRAGAFDDWAYYMPMWQERGVVFAVEHWHTNRGLHQPNLHLKPSALDLDSSAYHSRPLPASAPQSQSQSQQGSTRPQQAQARPQQLPARPQQPPAQAQQPQPGPPTACKHYPPNFPKEKEKFGMQDWKGNCFLNEEDWGTFEKCKSPEQRKAWMELHGLAATCAECRARKEACDHVWPCAPCKKAGLPCAFVSATGSKSHGKDEYACEWGSKCDLVHLQYLRFLIKVKAYRSQELQRFIDAYWEFPLQEAEMGKVFGTTDDNGVALSRKSAPLFGIARVKDLTMNQYRKFKNAWGYQSRFAPDWIRTRFFPDMQVSETVAKQLAA